MTASARPEVPFCPSTGAGRSGAVLIGVVGGTAERPLVRYLDAAHPVTDELLALTAPVSPAEVLRVAAPCAFSACRHFDDSSCTLATKVVANLPAVTDELPACAIRSVCRWYAQEGGAACRRCPQVVTENWNPSPVMAVVANPDVTPAEAARTCGGAGAAGSGAEYGTRTERADA